MGRREVYEVENGIPLIKFLRENNIPSHAIIAISNNKPLKLEDRIKSDVLCLNMYNYDIATFMSHIKKSKIIYHGKKEDIVFFKKIFNFKEDGNVQPLIIAMDRRSFSNYYEDRLKKTVTEKCEIKEGDKIAVGFSGGVDSCSFLSALNNSKLIDNIDVVAITVTGVPDAETIKGIEHTKYLTSKLRVPHLVSRPEDIEEIYHLKRPFIEIIDELLRDKTAISKTIFICHAVIRRIIEEYARKENIKKICFCIEAEGMMANILSSLTSGYPLLGIFKRKTEEFEYLYPLALFTKSENLLYLFFHDRKLILQEPSGEVHIKAPDLRTINFVLFESINNTAWGTYEYVIEGFDRLFKKFFTLTNVRIRKCHNCGGTFLEFQKHQEKDELCYVCRTLVNYIE